MLPNVYIGFVNNLRKNVEKSIDFSTKIRKIYLLIAYSLIKSGGGNGPMKPGNLSIMEKVPNPAANER